MGGSTYALVELLLVFGGVIAFIHWQFRELNRRARARERGELPGERGRDGAKDRGSP